MTAATALLIVAAMSLTCWMQTRWSWCAYTRSGPHRWAQTPAAALAAVGYVDPEATS